MLAYTCIVYKVYKSNTISVSALCCNFNKPNDQILWLWSLKTKLTERGGVVVGLKSIRRPVFLSIFQLTPKLWKYLFSIFSNEKTKSIAREKQKPKAFTSTKSNDNGPQKSTGRLRNIIAIDSRLDATVCELTWLNDTWMLCGLSEWLNAVIGFGQFHLIHTLSQRRQ